MENEPSPAHPAATEASVAAPANPERAEKHNSWTREKMARFLEAFADTGSVATAAKCVGMSRQSAYRLRSRLIGQPFDVAWEGALEFGLQQVAHAALDRALNGTAVPIYYRGEQVGERRVFNERAVMNLMACAEQIGRNPVGRDFTSRNWISMVRRVERGPMVWTDDEHAGTDPEHPTHKDDDDDDDADNMFDEPDIDSQSRAFKIQEEADRFAEEESHYAQAYDPPHQGRRRGGMHR